MRASLTPLITLFIITLAEASVTCVKVGLQPKPHGPIQLGRLAHGREQLEATLELTQSTLETTAAMEDVEQAALEVPLAITNCWNHDICSYFNNASGGASDANCGSAYTAAEDDYLLGGVDGCTQTNPATQLLHLPRNLSVLNEHSI
ncbi:hydrolytic enzyme protein [Botrytis cinerea]